MFEEFPESSFVFKKKRSRKKSKLMIPLLLDLIEKHPVIYDFNDPNYGKNNSLNTAWSEISSQMNVKGLFSFKILIIFMQNSVF